MPGAVHQCMRYYPHSITGFAQAIACPGQIHARCSPNIHASYGLVDSRVVYAHLEIGNFRCLICQRYRLKPGDGKGLLGVWPRYDPPIQRLADAEKVRLTLVLLLRDR